MECMVCSSTKRLPDAVHCGARDQTSKKETRNRVPTMPEGSFVEGANGEEGKIVEAGAAGRAREAAGLRRGGERVSGATRRPRPAETRRWD